MTLNKLLLSLTFTASVLAQGPVTPPAPVLATKIYNITSTTTIDCGITVVACIDNRSLLLRQNNYHAYRASGTGTWSVDMQFADGTPVTWTSYGATGQVNNVSSSSGIGYGLDPVSGKTFHDYIRFVIVGAASVSNYVGVKDVWQFPSSGSLSFPLGIGQGGSGTSSPLVGVLRGGSGAFTGAELSGDAATSGSNAVTVKGLNGTLLSSLLTGLLKITTGTGVPSAATSADVVGLFLNCSGALLLGADGGCHPGGSGNSISASDYRFTAQSPGGALSIGANAIVMVPVPIGVNGADVAHYLYVSGGTGAAEACLITGGSGTSGQTTGTIIVTCANTHSGAWTIQTATGGIQEAVCSLPSAGGNIQSPANLTLNANVSTCAKTSVEVDKPTSITMSGAFTVFGVTPAGTLTQQITATPASVGASQINGNVANSVAGGIYALGRASVNNFPISQEFQGSATPTIVGYDGAVDGSTSYPGASAIFGVSGYARTNYASAAGGTAAVGIFAAGYDNVNASGSNVTQTWAANFSINNCGGTNCTTGFGNNNSYGLEIDVNMYPSVGAAVSNAQGLWLAGGSTIQPSGVADAIHVGALGQFTSPQIKWKNAIEVDPGSAIVGLLVGTADTSTNPSGCMPIRLTSRSSGGINQYQEINCDSGGDLIFKPGTAAGQVVLEDIGGNIGASLVPSGTTPYLSVSNQVRMGATGSILIPAIQAATGTPAVLCINNAGQVIKGSTASCTGT